MERHLVPTLLALATLAVPAGAITITTATLPPGTVGAQYSEPIAITGQQGQRSWSLIGDLPLGLALASNSGTISGTPVTAGTYRFSVRVTDNNSSDTREFSLVINPVLLVATATLPDGTLGVAYSQTLTATGGSGDNTWARTAGSLPAGLVLSATGTISGTPTAVSSSTFTVRVTDAAGATASRNFAITILLVPLSVTTASLPGGVVGTNYSQTLAATGGSGGYSWTRLSGALPAGLTLSAAGVIGGTPTAFGTASFTVRVTDSGNRTADKALTITIDPTPPVISTTSLPAGQVTVAYSQSLAATGGSGGFVWSIASGSLPAGLSLSGAGAITGTPTAAGTSNFTVKVTDSGNRTGTKALSIAIAPAPLIVTTAASLPNATVGVAYSQTLEATGGSGGNAWTITTGTLPAGLALSGAGAITGTPTTAGTANFTVRVADDGGRTANKALTIVVDPPPLVITTASLPNATGGIAYSQMLEATGGSGGNAWTIASGALPAGLALSAAGAITGTPTTAGTASFTVKVADNGGRSATKALTLIVEPPLVITTASLPNATVGIAYSQTLEATGGTGGNAWTIASGALPAGLTLSAGGTIAGTPTAAGTANFTARVADNGGHSATKALTLIVDPPGLVITTASLPNATVGVAYSQTLEATGGGGGNTWTVAGGALPAGLALSAAGAITGTPTAAGTANFTVRVADNGGRAATKAFTVIVDPPALVISTASLPNATVGVAYSQLLAATGGTGGNAWAIATGALPVGLALSGAGAITGTPTTPGTANFTARVADNGGHTTTKALTLIVDPPVLTISTASLPPGTVGGTYSFTLAATGGTGAGYVWSVTSGILAAGLSLAPNGTLAGRPTTAGSFSFTAQVKDSAGATATKALVMTVSPSTLVITTQALPSGSQGSAYSQALAATGGSGGYRWSLDAGSLPDGLTLDPTGRITGTVTGSSATFTVAVADSSGVSVTRNLVISVTPPLSLPTAASLASGVTGTTYSGTIGAAGGLAPYSFAVSTGQLPPGLVLDAGTGAITGRPTQVGSFTFGIQVRDAAGTQMQASYTIVIANTLTVINPPVLPTGSIGVAYQVVLTAAGGTAPYAWSATAGSLPGGLTFKPDGTIDGTPATAGTFTFTATVSDALGAKTSKEFTLTIAATLTITTAPQLPQGVPGGPYNATLAASGGTAPYLWSVVSGSLPDGLRLDAATGAITGVPTAPVTANFSVRVADSGQVTAQKAFTLTVAPGVTFTSPATLPDAVAGEAYTFTLAATGGQTPYSWRIADAALPDGLALNATSGIISGTPSAAGTFNFTVEVADAAGLKTTRVHTLVVNLPSVATLRLSGVPATLGPMQQPQVDLAIANAYPVAITGRLNLSFVPAAGMPDDPSVQFSSGGRSVAFTIAANDTRAVFSIPRLLMQSGSVAGTINFTVESLRAGTATLPAPTSPIATAQVPPAATVVQSVEVRRSSGGFDLVVKGATTTRELARMIVRFRPPAGATLQTPEVTIELADAAKGWFQSAGSAQYGGLFSLTVPFSFVGGPSTIESVGVILANSVGASQEGSGPY